MRVIITKVNTELRFISHQQETHSEIYVVERPSEKDEPFSYRPIYGPFCVINAKDYSVGQELELMLYKVRGDGSVTDTEVE